MADITAAQIRHGDVVVPLQDNDLPQVQIEIKNPKGFGSLKQQGEDLALFTDQVKALATTKTLQERFTGLMALSFNHNRLIDLVQPAKLADPAEAVAELAPTDIAADLSVSHSKKSSSEMLRRESSEVDLLASKKADESRESLSAVIQETTFSVLTHKGISKAVRDVPEAVEAFMPRAARGRRLAVVTKAGLSPSFLSLGAESEKSLQLYNFSKPLLTQLDATQRYQYVAPLVFISINLAKPTLPAPQVNPSVLRLPTSPLLFQGDRFPFPTREALTDFRTVIVANPKLGNPADGGKRKDGLEMRFDGRENLTPIAFQVGPLPDAADPAAEGGLLRLIVGFLPLFQYVSSPVSAVEARDLRAAFKVYLNSHELLGFTMIKKTILDPAYVDYDEKGALLPRVGLLDDAYNRVSQHAEAMMRAARWKIGEKKGYLELANVAGRKDMDNTTRILFLRLALGMSLDHLDDPEATPEQKAAEKEKRIHILADYIDYTLVLVETLRPAALRVSETETNSLLIGHLALAEVLVKRSWKERDVPTISTLFISAADVAAAQGVDTDAEIKVAKDAFLLRQTGATVDEKKTRINALKAETTKTAEEEIASEARDQLATAAVAILGDGAALSAEAKAEEIAAMGAIANYVISNSSTADTDVKIVEWTLRTMSDAKEYTRLYADAVRRGKTVSAREVQMMLIRLFRSIPLLISEAGLPSWRQIQGRLKRNFIEVTPIVAEYLAHRVYDDYFADWESKEERKAFAEFPYAAIVKLGQLARRPVPNATDPEALPVLGPVDSVNARIFDEFFTLVLDRLDQKTKVVLSEAPPFLDEKRRVPSLVFWGRDTPYTIGVSDSRNELVYLDFQPLESESATFVFKKHSAQERTAYELILKSESYKNILALVQKVTTGVDGKPRDLATSPIAFDSLLDYILRSETVAVAAQRLRLKDGISWTDPNATGVTEKALVHLRTLVETAILIASDQINDPKGSDQINDPKGKTRLLINYDTLAAAVSIGSVTAAAHEMAVAIMAEKVPAGARLKAVTQTALLDKSIQTLLSTNRATQKLADYFGTPRLTGYTTKLNEEKEKAQKVIAGPSGRIKKAPPAAPSIAPQPPGPAAPTPSPGPTQPSKKPAGPPTTETAPNPSAPAPTTVPVTKATKPKIRSIPEPEGIVNKDTEIEQLKEEVDRVRAQLASTEKDKKGLEAKVESLEDTLQQRKTTLDELRGDLKKAREQAGVPADTSRRLADLEKEKESLTQGLAEAKKALAETQQELEGNEAELKQADELIKKYLAELSMMTAQVAAAELRARESETRAAQVTTDRTTLATKLQGVETARDKLDADLVTMRAHLDELKAQVKAVKETGTEAQIKTLETVQAAQAKALEHAFVSSDPDLSGSASDLILQPDSVLTFTQFAGIRPRQQAPPAMPSLLRESPHLLRFTFYGQTGQEVLALENRNAYVEFLAQEEGLRKGDRTRIFEVRMAQIIGLSAGERSDWIWMRQGGEGGDWHKLTGPILVPRQGSVTIEYRITDKDLERSLNPSVLIRRAVSFHYQVPNSAWPSGAETLALLQSQEVAADQKATKNQLIGRLVLHQGNQDAASDARYVARAGYGAAPIKVDLLYGFLITCTEEDGKAI
jgi:hypothetical protein